MPRLALPAAGLQHQERFDRGGHFGRRARHVEVDGAVFGEAIALAAQFFQLLRAERLAQHFIGVAGSVEAGADMRLQHHGLHAARRKTSVKAFMAAPSSEVARKISACAPACRACCRMPVTASSRHVAVEQRRAERAIGIRR